METLKVQLLNSGLWRAYEPPVQPKVRQPGPTGSTPAPVAPDSEIRQEPSFPIDIKI